MECRGWNGDNLLSLGAGKTIISPASSTVVRLQADQFTLDAGLVPVPSDVITLQPTPGVFAPPPVISPAMNLSSTTNLAVCEKHFSSDSFFTPVACANAVKDGSVILIWDWPAIVYPAGDPAYITKIDGFHVYQVLGLGKYVLVGKIPLADKNYEILPKSWATGGPFSFVVRAYKGAIESPNSNLYTLKAGASGVSTVVLPLANTASGGQYRYKTSSITTCKTGLGGSISLGSSPLVVGFDHVVPEDSCLKFYWEYYRAQFGFDLSLVKGPVSSAQLSYRQDYSSAPGQSCASQLGVVTTTTPGALPKDLAYDPYLLLSPYGYTGAVTKLDVTDQVRDWTLGAPNAGFLFVGRDEDLPSTSCGGFLEPGCIGGPSETCWSRYSDFALTVTYFKP